MASFNQATGTKRQKRDAKADYVDCFQGIDKVEYNSMASHGDTNCYRHYNASERVHSRAMEDWLKISVSLADFRSGGLDHHKTQTRPWDDNTNTIDNCKRCVKALFDFCIKLGIKYWTAFDSDLIPVTDNWDASKGYWDEMVEFVQDLGQRYHVKLLWLAPDLFLHPKYISGAFTSNDATSFTQAAAQIKRCLEISQRLNAETFLLWPHREGYDHIFQTEVQRELKLFAKLLKMTAEYKDRINYRCQLLIMPYDISSKGYNRNCGSNFKDWRDGVMVYKYMWDVTSCLYFLRSYNMERHFKVISPPGHHLFMATAYNMLGGVAITNAFDHYDNKKITLMMKCIIDQNSPPPAGINLSLRARRDSAPRDLITFHGKYVDALARGLRVAAGISADQVFSKHLQHRYASYYSGFGSRLASGEVTMEECEDYYKKNQQSQQEANRSEHSDVMFQRYVDTCAQV